VPRYLTPFVAIVATTWLGGIVSGFVLVGGPEWAQPTVAVTPPPAVTSPTPSLGISGAVVSLTPLPPGASGSTAPEATSPPLSAPPTVPPSLVAPSGVPATAQPTARRTRAPSAPPKPSSIPTLAPTVPPTLAPTPEPTAPPITPPPTLPPTPPPSVAVSCGNGVDNSGGLGLICEVTIIAGVSATIRECHGAAGDPQAACSIRTIDGRVTSVSQCNGSVNGGGSVLRCSVHVVGGAGPPATVNQCVGSGATIGCSPFPATATGATVTQCNGTGNGGTLVGLICTASGSQSVTVDQCNGSVNGGGALVGCFAVLE
jgi:hypothetical protein